VTGRGQQITGIFFVLLGLALIPLDIVTNTGAAAPVNLITIGAGAWMIRIGGKKRRRGGKS